MRLQIESTEKIVILKIDGASIPARVWQGETESGIPVHCFITRVAVREDAPAEELEHFERELQEQAKPRADVAGIPLSLVL